MALALLGKCVIRLALILLLYICYIYAFKIRDGSVVHPFSSTIGEHSQRATCIGSKFGKCPEKTVTTSNSAMTSSSRRWHTATSSQVSSIGKKPPVEMVSSNLEGETNIQKIGSRLISTHHSDKSLPGFLVRRKENIVDDKKDDDEDGETEVEDEEEEEIQAEDEDDDSEELRKDYQSEDNDEDDEYDEQSKSIELKETKREAEVKDKEKEDHGTMNILGWSFKYSADSFSKSTTTTKDTKEMKYGKGIVEDQGKEKKISSIVKEKEDKKDIVKDNIKIEEESSIVRKQQKKIQRRDLGQVEESDKMDDTKGKNEDGNDNDNESEDQSKVTLPIIRKLERIKHADKEIVNSVERPISKSINKIKDTKIPKEKVKKELQQITEEPKKIETTKPTKTETTEEKELKETKSTKVTKIKIEEKKVKKSESIEPTKDKSDEDKKTKKTEIVKATKIEPESSKSSLKSEEKRKPIAKTETPKITTPSTKTKNEVDKSIKAKVKIEVPHTARNETKSKTKKLRDATESLADLNDKILNVPTFVPNFTAIENTNCQQHGKIFLRQLRGYKLWAFQMLDSSAKISSSILRGNVNQLGDFDQCLGIMSHVKMGNRTIKIQGKYCLANIDIHATKAEMRLPVNLMQGRTLIKSNMRDPGHFIPKFTTIKWGLCLPAACTAKDAEMTLINTLSYYNSTSGIKFMVGVNPDMCYTKQKSQNYSKETIGVIYFYVAVVCLAIIATLRDYLITSEGKGNYSERIIMSFSLRRTVKSLFKEIKPNSTDITCIHGLRSIFMIILYIGHKIISLGLTPYINRTSLTETANHPLTVFLRASSNYTDGFLLLSGLLTSYNMAKELTFRGEIRWFCRLIVRFIRLTPALIVMIFWYAFVMEHIGSGPQWNSIVVDNAELCKKNAWTNLLYIQNFFPFEEMCATHTHQLALDMQLSLLAPILVFFLQCKPIIGIILLFFLIQVSATLRYIATVNNYLSMIVYHGVTIKNLYKVANLSYALPLHRLTPYALGVGLGVLLHYTGKNVKIHKVFMILGWLIAMTFGTWSIFSSWRSATRDYVYDVEESTYYVVIAPILWALSLCWTIFACFTDHGGILNKFLSNYWFIVFSRISYAVYLTQFAVFFYNIGTTKYATEFLPHRPIDLIEILVVIFVSIVTTLLFDFPMQEIKNVIMESTDSLAVNIPAEKQKDETKETNGTQESVKKIGNGSKVFKDDDWQNGKIDKKLNNKNIEDKEMINISRTRKSDERRRSSTGYDDNETRSRINRSNQRTPYMFDSEEEAMEYFRKEEETIRNRRSVSRTKEMKRSVLIENEDDYIRRRNEEDYVNQYRRSKSKERVSAREHDDYCSWEFVNKERSASTGPDSMRFLNEPEEYVSKISRRSLPRSVDSRRTFSSESEDEPPVQRRSKNERRYPSVEPKVSDEEEWEEELRIRRRQFMEKLAGQKSGSSEKEGDVTSLRRRSSAEGRIALLKDPSGNENMDAWTVSVGPRIAQLGSSQEPSEPEDDSFYHQRREYREKAPPFRETPHTEVKESSIKDDKDVTNFNFVLTKDSKRKSVQDLSTLSQDDTDLTESGWSLVKEEVVETLPKSSLGLYKRESIIKSQASEEDPEYYLPERPKLVQQEQEHPFKKAWQMQKSRSEEDALAYIVKDKKLSQSETTKDEDESSTSMKDTSGEKSESLEDMVSEETETLSTWQDRSTDTEDNPQSSKSEIGSDIDSISIRQSPNTHVDDSGPCSISENDSDTTQFVWPTEDEQFETYKTGPRRKSMETNWDWEEEET